MLEPFLGVASFSGPWTAAEQVRTSFAAQTYFHGVVAFSNWRREDAAAMLPEDLELGDTVVPSENKHPVVFTFGEHAGSAILFGSVGLTTGVRFPEMIIAVPFVRHRHDRSLHLFVARIFAGEGVVTWSGNAHYGFNKHMADMAWLGQTFVVSEFRGPLLMHATVDGGAAWRAGGACDLPNFRAMAEVFRLPALGRRQDGTYAVSYFEWDFDQGRVRPADAAISIDVPLGPGLGPRVCHGVASGTFGVRDMRWRISWPARARF
jgi:hypothetical protein